LLVAGAAAAFFPGMTTHALERDECWGDFTLKPYAMTNLAEYQAVGIANVANATGCTLNGRTGYASLSATQPAGDLTVYTWICDADGKNCGVDDEESGVYCTADVQSRDSSKGTALGDRPDMLGYQTRWNVSWGQMLGEVPTDENNEQPADIQMLRVHCYWDH
jgi:hypothetical protein